MQVVGLRAPAVDQRGDELGRVAARHPPAVDGVVERLLHAVAAEQHDLARIEVARELLAEALILAALALRERDAGDFFRLLACL